ncbi:MAG: serine/threonine protein kinase [Thermoleophilia bacterium]|nr:serine/threonine protein kinase [Thermoleophilia bacterium]
MVEPPLLHDRYRIVRKLGSGAFATVYLAEDQTMGRPVAVKVVEDSDDLDSRPLREAQAAAKLDHPHIVTVHEVVREPTRTLLFTEYVEGATLRELYTRRDLSDTELLQAGIQICRALEHAHRRGVVHRDIKPENIMLVEGEDVDVRVMDFGVARLEDLGSITLDGELVGTLAYMAPEQLEGRNVDAKADVYALSLTLYEGFTGKNPLKGQKPAELLRGPAKMVFSRLSRSRPDLPAELDDALHRGLEKDPEIRLDAAGLRRMLEKAARSMPEEEERPTLVQRAGGRIARRVDPARLVFAFKHVVSGLLALGTLAYVLPRVPFYPDGALLPLTAGVAFLALIVPLVGAALALLLVAAPVFSFAAGWGVVYALAAAAWLGLLRRGRREWAVLLPGVAPLLVLGHVGLAYPAIAGLLLRRWGPPAALLGGSVVAMAAGMAGWAELPYAFTTGVGPVLLDTAHVGSPWVVAEAFARLLDQRPELLAQILLFGVFALPPYRWFRGSGIRRLWVAAGYLATLFAAFALVPPLAVKAPVDTVALLLAFVPCAIIVGLSALLIPSEGPSQASEG